MRRQPKPTISHHDNTCGLLHDEISFQGTRRRLVRSYNLSSQVCVASLAQKVHRKQRTALSSNVHGKEYADSSSVRIARCGSLLVSSACFWQLPTVVSKSFIICFSDDLALSNNGLCDQSSLQPAIILCWFSSLVASCKAKFVPNIESGSPA